MRRYDIRIDCPAGSRVDEETLREVLPEWVDASDEAEAEAMIAAALSRWAEDRHERILEHVTVWPSRVHVRERPHRGGYDNPPPPRVRILARRRVQGVPTGPWLHLSDDDVLSHAPTGILAEWRYLRRTEGTWSWRPWSVESWEWVADAPAPEPPTDLEVRLEVRADDSVDERSTSMVVLVDAKDGGELSTLAYHYRRKDAIASARRVALQLRIPLLVPDELESPPDSTSLQDLA